jgi:hypothetical protein
MASIFCGVAIDRKQERLPGHQKTAECAWALSRKLNAPFCRQSF